MENAQNIFLTYIREQHLPVSKWFQQVYQDTHGLIIDKLLARLIISEVNFEPTDQKSYLEVELCSVPGFIVPFLKESDYSEIGFEPYERIEYSFSDILSVAKSKEPWIWTSLDVFHADVWHRLNLHEFAEPIKLTDNHSIIIDKIQAEEIQQSVAMGKFDGGIEV